MMTMADSHTRFWTEQCEAVRRDPEHHIVADGVKYFIANETPSYRGGRGFNGAKFTFERLSDGERLVSTNCWHNGAVPVDWRDRIPDTHRIVKEVPHADAK